MKLQAQKILFKTSKKKKNKAISEKDFDLLLKYCKDGKELYNFILYVVRQKYFKQRGQRYNLEFIKDYKDYPLFMNLLLEYFEDKNLFSNHLSAIACRFSELKNLHFNTKVSQGIYRQVFADFQSFFKLLKKRVEGNYTKKVNLPKYKRKDYVKVVLNKQVLSMRLFDKGYVGTTKCEQGIRLNNSKITRDNLQAVELNYKNECLVVNIIYQITEFEVKTLEDVDIKNAKVCGMDLGVNNLFTITFNFDQKPITLRNGYLKSVNQWYNKEISRLKSLLPEKVYASKKIESITRKRNETMKNNLNYYSNHLVAVVKRLGIEVIVIGKNIEWKQNTHNLSEKKQFKYKKNKVWIQSFVQLPLAKFIDTLKYKLEKEGVVVLLQEESYTSKASFLDKDMIPTYGDDEIEHKFSGYRKNRSDYKLKNKDVIVHADVNGAYNIMRKAGFNIKVEDCKFLNQKYIYPLNFIKVKETQKVV